MTNPSLPPTALIQYLNTLPTVREQLSGTPIGSSCDPVVGGTTTLPQGTDAPVVHLTTVPYLYVETITHHVSFNPPNATSTLVEISSVSTTLADLSLSRTAHPGTPISATSAVSDRSIGLTKQESMALKTSLSLEAQSHQSTGLPSASQLGSAASVFTRSAFAAPATERWDSFKSSSRLSDSAQLGSASTQISQIRPATSTTLNSLNFGSSTSLSIEFENLFSGLVDKSTMVVASSMTKALSSLAMGDTTVAKPTSATSVANGFPHISSSSLLIMGQSSQSSGFTREENTLVKSSLNVNSHSTQVTRVLTELKPYTFTSVDSILVSLLLSSTPVPETNGYSSSQLQQHSVVQSRDSTVSNLASNSLAPNRSIASQSNRPSTIIESSGVDSDARRARHMLSLLLLSMASLAILL